MKATVVPWRNRGLVYLSVPKAACSSVKWALREARGLPQPDPWWKIHGIEWPEQMLFDRVRECGQNVFTVVRHPVDRLCSCYVSKMHKDRIHDLRGTHPQIDLDMSFEEFADFCCHLTDEEANDHIAGQVHLLSDSQGIIPARVIKMNNLKSEWPAFAKKFRLPELGTLNSSGNWAINTRKSIQQMICKRYESDFKAFGFTNR